MDSVTEEATDDKTSIITTTAQHYELYNIVSETGDSIFYDPSISNSIFDNEKEKVTKLIINGQIFIAADLLEKIDDKVDLLQKSHARLRHDLVNSGVLKTV